MSRSASKINTFGNRPPPNEITFKISFLHKTSRSLLAVALEMSALWAKSTLVETGLSKIQSKAETAFGDRVRLGMCFFKLSYRLSMS